jgi:hypothetical protein
MSERKPLTEAQLRALAALTYAYPSGFTYGEDKIEARALLDGLVESGHLHATDLDGGERGYQLSEELAKAHLVTAARQAEQAAAN